MTQVEISSIIPFIADNELSKLTGDLMIYHHELISGQGAGSEFTGWLRYPSMMPENLLERIRNTAELLRNQSDAVVVVGIGGSYLGARAVIDALNNPFAVNKRGNPAIVYAGHHLSENYHARLLNWLDSKEWSMIVVSKSGTTTEPAIAFRLLREKMLLRYGHQQSRKRIVTITDKKIGALKRLADTEGFETFEIPDEIGGRYSVLTPAGLLPIAVSGCNVDSIISGAVAMESKCLASYLPSDNPASLYAVARNALYRSGKPIELLVNYEPALNTFTEWWKQLYGESEGKQHRGIFPAGVSFTTDLHSMGQYIQQGLRVIFETVLSVESPSEKLVIPFSDNDSDGLNFLAGKRLNEVNRMAELGTMLAHIDGKVPNIRIAIPELNEHYLGQLIYFFEFACALSGYILGVNPFDQPGVEAYKRNMFALLNKPGFQAEGELLRNRLLI